MDLIRSPGKLLELCQESTWSPSGVFLEFIWTSLKVAAIVHYQRILLDSRYTPPKLLMESIRMGTILGLLIQSFQNPSRTPPVVQLMDSNLIEFGAKMFIFLQIQTLDFHSHNKYMLIR
jgi:hypothetical protein